MIRFLEYFKDIVGLVGTVLATIPFYREMGTRKDLQEAEDTKGVVGTGATAAFSAIANHLRASLFKADQKDFFLVTIGLALLSVSFVFSLLVTALKP